jgi:hypothetical protein
MGRHSEVIGMTARCVMVLGTTSGGWKKLADHSPVPLLRAPGAEGGAIQGAEHEQ